MTGTQTLTLFTAHQQQITRRHIAELIREVSAAQWRRRAEEWEWCRPRADDYQGRATLADLADRDRRCAEIAQACRNKADVLERGWADPMPELDAALREVA